MTIVATGAADCATVVAADGARVCDEEATLRGSGLLAKYAPTRNNFVAKKNKNKKNHLEIVFSTSLPRSTPAANFHVKIDKVSKLP